MVAFSDGDSEPIKSLAPRDRARVQQAADTLPSRYFEPWAIAGLAREVGINERKLKQGFREVLGRTVHKHLERTRVSDAKNLLSEEGLGVTETALAVGYSNPSQFLNEASERRQATGAAAPKGKECVNSGQDSVATRRLAVLFHFSPLKLKSRKFSESSRAAPLGMQLKSKFTSSLSRRNTAGFQRS